MTRPRLAQTARRLETTLASAGFEILGGTNLFQLTKRRRRLVYFEIHSIVVK
jgi:hypothetical protein